MSDIILNEDEQDCLQELMNIAYGSATAAITEILDAYATLSIPMIRIINSNELSSYFKDELNSQASHFVCTQQFNGKISGENLFIVDNTSAKNMALQFGLEENEINDAEISDIILEITNILSSSTISKFSEELNIPVSFSPPSIDIFETLINLDNEISTKSLSNHYLIVLNQ